MRRKIAMLLCMIMCITAFSGCSKAELGYYRMYQDAQTIEKSAGTGTLTGEIDFDELSKFVGKAMGIETEENLFETNGKKTFTMNYTTINDNKELAYAMRIDVVFDGKTYDFGDIYCDFNKGIFISGKAMSTFLDLYCMMHPYDLMTDEAYIAEMKQYFESQQSIMVMSADELGGGVFFGEDFVENQIDEKKFLEEAFGGFSTGLVTEITNGYKFEADGMMLTNKSLEMINYMLKNFDKIWDAILKNVMEADAGIAQADGFAYDMGKMDIFNTADEAKDVLSQTHMVLSELSWSNEWKTIAENIKFETSLKKESSTYVAESKVTLADGGKTIFSLHDAARVSATNEKISVPTNYVSLAAFTAQANAIESKYNPIMGVNIYWEDESPSAEIYQSQYYYPLFGEENYDAIEAEYIIREGYTYLPLRTICDALGRQIVWDQKTKTASVVIDGAEVALETFIQDGRAYIKVRDFEKLGYVVDYFAEDGVKVVWIYQDTDA